MTADADPLFAHPRLAATYDVFQGERDDLAHYEAIIREAGAQHVLDIGCGTGELACRLAERGLDVTGVDPAAASIELARRKPHASEVTWLIGTVDDVPAGRFDLAVMTGNVAQVFVGDDDWEHVLRGVGAAVRPGGRFVFETRDPAARAWKTWTPNLTRSEAVLPNGDLATTWCEVTAVRLPLVSFRWTTTFGSDGAELVSESTLRFRTGSEIEASLDEAGFEVVDVRDAPDRPRREWVYVTRRV